MICFYDTRNSLYSFFHIYPGKAYHVLYSQLKNNKITPIDFLSVLITLVINVHKGGNPFTKAYSECWGVRALTLTLHFNQIQRGGGIKINQ